MAAHIGGDGRQAELAQDTGRDTWERRLRTLDAENRQLRMQVEQLRGALRRGAEDYERLAAEFRADIEVRALALRQAADENQQRLIGALFLRYRG
jgi:hypothetical protein